MMHIRHGSDAWIEDEYRYLLSRRWSDEQVLLWVMLNPSTADASKDDPTIRKCCGFARRWGYGGILVVNLFALRATNPKELRKHPFPVGPRNDDAIASAALACPDSVCAWGGNSFILLRGEFVLRLLRGAGNSPTHLGLTKHRAPRHPLYLPYATGRELWQDRAATRPSAGGPKERPVLFSGPMVRAILEGRKTQTRRVVAMREFGRSDTEGWEFSFRDRRGHWNEYTLRQLIESKWNRYGAPGDRLWVRETYCVVDDRELGGVRWVDYRATPRYSGERPAGWDNAPDDLQALRWHPSIHMPRWASRLLLEVTGVRVERLGSATEPDVRAEGVGDQSMGWGRLAVEFQKLWDSINSKRAPWASNPWVWVVEFNVARDAGGTKEGE